jgi:hypothetical protein
MDKKLARVGELNYTNSEFYFIPSSFFVEGIFFAIFAPVISWEFQ